MTKKNKINRIWQTIAFAFVLGIVSLGLNSCSSDDDGANVKEEESLYGWWGTLEADVPAVLNIDKDTKLFTSYAYVDQEIIDNFNEENGKNYEAGWYIVQEVAFDLAPGSTETEGILVAESEGVTNNITYKVQDGKLELTNLKENIVLVLTPHEPITPAGDGGFLK